MFVVGGESLIDLVQEPPGPDGVVRLTAHPGGSPYNCALALARLGNDTGFLCPISRDGFGTRLAKRLAEAGASVLLDTRVAEPTSLAVVTLDDRMAAQYEFYRGADRAFTADGLVAALPANPELLQLGGFCPIEPDDAEAWLVVAREASARGATLSIDPNVRPSLVADFAAYKARLSRFLDLVHLVKLSDEDLRALDPDRPVEDHARSLLERPNCELVVVTRGEAGSMAFTASGSAMAGIYAPPVFGDTVGAGDSLMAGILTLLAERDALRPGSLRALGSDALDDMLRFGAVTAGLNCAQRGCNPPNRAEVNAVLVSDPLR